MLKEQPTKSIGLVGQYGCGKSSLLNLVESHLWEDKKIILSKIGAWGFREGRAVELVLEHITEDIADHIDVLSIAALPRQYQAMLSGCGNGIAKIISGIFTPRKPIEILEKIDGLLKKTGFRVVVFLEDLDRNFQQDVLFEEVATLLDSLHRLKKITFVLAIGNHSEAEKLLTRLCEHIEIIPPLNKKDTLDIIEKFREMCLGEHPVEDVVQKEKRDKIFGAERGDFVEYFKDTGDFPKDPIDYAAILLQTPRALKASLRRTWQTWSRLAGEIDFDEMFLVTILRESAPEAFLFLNQNINVLRSVSQSRSGSDKEKEMENKVAILDQGWEEYTMDVEWDRKVVRGIIKELFPGWIGKDERLTPYEKAILAKDEILQGFLKTEPTDYWQRFSRECVVKDDILDQTVIEAIRKWQKKHEDTVYQSWSLAEALYRINGFAEKLEQFGILFSQKEIRELASQLFEIALNNKGAETTQENCVGFVNLWRLAKNKAYNKKDNWVLSEIRKAIQISLQFANDICYWWAYSISLHILPFVEFREQHLHAFKDLCDNNPSMLLRILTLFGCMDLATLIYKHGLKSWMVKENGGYHSYPIDNTNEDWKWIGETLFDASKEDKAKIVPQIIWLIYDMSHKRIKMEIEDDCLEDKITYDTALNEEKMKYIFGDRKRRVMETVATEIDISQYDSQPKDIIENAREQARQWLKENQK